MNINTFERLLIHKYIGLLLDVCEQRGIEPSALLAGTQLSYFERDNLPPHISEHAMLKVERNLLEMFDDPGIGLDVGKRLNASWYGLVGFAMMTSHSLGAGLEVFLHYSDTLIKAPTEYHLHTECDSAVLSMADRQQLNEILPLELSIEFASIFTIIGNITGGAFEARELQLGFRPPDLASYQSFFCCPLTICRRHALIFDRDWLDYPLPLADQDSHQILLGLCEEVTRNSQENPLVWKIRDLLRPQIEALPPMSVVASELGMSTRTLRRRLSELDTSYQEIANRLKQAAALEYVTGSELSIEQVAARTGYADAANFREAFKAWTGETPQNYRRAHRETILGEAT